MNMKTLVILLTIYMLLVGNVLKSTRLWIMNIYHLKTINATGDGVSEQLISQRNNDSQIQGSKHAKTLWFQLKERHIARKSKITW